MQIWTYRADIPGNAKVDMFLTFYHMFIITFKILRSIQVQIQQSCSGTAHKASLVLTTS